MKSDYQNELDRIETAIAESGPDGSTDSIRAVTYAYNLYQRAVLTGDLDGLAPAEWAIDAAIPLLPNPHDLYLLKANLAFKVHRLTDVKRWLSAVPSLSATIEARAMLADLDFQEGRYAAARAGYLRIIEDDVTWDSLARLAFFESSMGRIEEADALYAQAEDELTAKEMRSFAWVELQRGLLDLTRGRHEDAMAHYSRADRAYTGHWLTAEHIAEAVAAQGDFVTAAGLYEDVLERVPKPELRQALGELYGVMGEHARAQPLFARAHAAFLESAERGEVHYYHHLADLCADVLKDGAEAVKWARHDIALRDNHNTRAALAWALFRNEQCSEAAEWTDLALETGAASAHLFHRAAVVFRAAGRAGDGARYDAMANEMNPRLRSFHMHR